MCILINISWIWAPKNDQTPPKKTIKNEAYIFMHFFVDFGAVLPPPALPLGSLSVPFGCFWAPLVLSLAPLGSHFGPPGHHPESFHPHGLILKVFSLTLGRLRAPF